MSEEYKYLVANPFGCFLARCKTMEDVKDFVNTHLASCKEAYFTLARRNVEASEYQVRDLTGIPTYKKEKTS